MRSLLMKAGVLLFVFGVAGCSGSAPSAPNVPQPASHVPDAGPALKAPTLRKPNDIIGGPGLLSMLNTLLGDSAPVLGGKTLAHFYIGVREIDAIANGQTVVLGSASTPYQMDLLQYQNGSTNWMSQTSVPAQTYSQLRYVFDMPSAQAVFADGTTLPVKFISASSASSYGMGSNTTAALDPTYSNAVDVTLNAPFTLQSSSTAVAADFNLTESLSLSRGVIYVRPTLAASTTGGAITGTVLNRYGSGVSNATVIAIGSNGNAVNSATTDANGNFNVHTLPPDTYQLAIYNAYSNAAGYAIYASGNSWGGQGFYGPTVTVTAGSAASAGTIND